MSDVVGAYINGIKISISDHSPSIVVLPWYSTEYLEAFVAVLQFNTVLLATPWELAFGKPLVKEVISNGAMTGIPWYIKSGPIS